MNQFYQETRMHETNVDLLVLTPRRLQRLKIAGSGFIDDSLVTEWPGEGFSRKRKEYLEEDGAEPM